MALDLTGAVETTDHRITNYTAGTPLSRPIRAVLSSRGYPFTRIGDAEAPYNLTSELSSLKPIGYFGLQYLPIPAFFDMIRHSGDYTLTAFYFTPAGWENHPNT